MKEIALLYRINGKEEDIEFCIFEGKIRKIFHFFTLHANQHLIEINEFLGKMKLNQFKIHILFYIDFYWKEEIVIPHSNRKQEIDSLNYQMSTLYPNYKENFFLHFSKKQKGGNCCFSVLLFEKKRIYISIQKIKQLLKKLGIEKKPRSLNIIPWLAKESLKEKGYHNPYFLQVEDHQSILFGEGLFPVSLNKGFGDDLELFIKEFYLKCYELMYKLKEGSILINYDRCFDTNKKLNMHKAIQPLFQNGCIESSIDFLWYQCIRRGSLFSFIKECWRKEYE